MQDGKVIVYGSRQLKVHEKNYPTHNLETLFIWREVQFILGSQELEILVQKELNMRQHRWMELLKDYNFSLQYLRSKPNVIADALSRRPHSLISSSIIREW